MSWDVLLVDLPPGVRSIAEVPDEFSPGTLCARVELIAKVHSVAPEVDFSDPTWGLLRGHDFSVDLSVGADDPVRSLMLHVRGGDAAFGFIGELARVLGVPALDCSTGDLIDFDSPASKGFRAWRAYRKRVIDR